jgi:hypothetical protein
MGEMIVGILAMAAGVFSALGICFPRFRQRWAGISMKRGAVSCAGFSVFFLSFGVLWLCIDRVAERYRAWFIFPIILGCILITIGYVLDWRIYGQMIVTDPTLQPREPLVAKSRRWLLVVFGVVVLVVILQTIFSRK